MLRVEKKQLLSKLFKTNDKMLISFQFAVGIQNRWQTYATTNNKIKIQIMLKLGLILIKIPQRIGFQA